MSKLNKTPQLEAGLTAVSGIALLIAIGGIANAASLANQSLILTLMPIGLVYGIYHLVITVKGSGIDSWQESLHSPNAGLYAFVGLLTFLLLYFLSPTTAFNLHDDLHTYIPRVYGMLAYGSAGTNPLGLAGLDSLGAHTFMQTFLIALFPAPYINTYDAIFCFMLCALIVIELNKLLGNHWVVSLGSLLILALIHPQQVNISSVYSTTCLVLALAYFSVLFFQNLHGERTTALKYIAPIILICSALIATKLLSAIFASLFAIALSVCYISSANDKLREAGIVFKSGIALIMISLPWFVTHTDKYLLFINPELQSEGQSAVQAGDNLAFLQQVRFFNSTEMPWGGSHFAYNTLFLLSFTAMIFALYRGFTKQSTPQDKSVIIIFSAALVSYLLSLALFEYGMSLRYSLPLLIAMAPLMLILSSNTIKDIKTRNILCGLFVVFIAYTFYSSAIKRFNSITQDQTVVSFRIDERYSQYMRDTLHNDKFKNAIAKLQDNVPEGAKIWSWISTAHHLDMKRNETITMSNASVLTPAFKQMTKNSDSESIKKFFLENNIDYVIWEHKGYGMKTPQQYKKASALPMALHAMVGKKMYNFWVNLGKLSAESERLFMDKNFILFKIQSNEQT